MSEGAETGDSSASLWKSDFHSVEMAQLRAALSATPAERLAMLEELIELARRAGALPRPAGDRRVGR